MTVHNNKMATHIFTKNKYVVQKDVRNSEGQGNRKTDEFREGRGRENEI
jgi:hypothetical protein